MQHMPDKAFSNSCLSAINLVLVLFCQKHYRENKVLKTILTIICGCTYIMIASSTMRMLLYIASYQLTFLRIFVLVSLLTLAICLTGVVISIYKSSFPLFFFMTVTVTVCYLLSLWQDRMRSPQHITVSGKMWMLII